MHVRYSVKCLRGLKLSFDSFLAVVVSHVSFHVSIVIFHCIFRLPNPVLRADSFL
jgi:hypothetical protein